MYFYDVQDYIAGAYENEPVNYKAVKKTFYQKTPL